MKHLMQPDPDAPTPSAFGVLYLVAAILLVIVVIAHYSS